MSGKSKKYRAGSEKIESGRAYSLTEAVALLKQVVSARFNETIELVSRLGIEPRHSEQLVRGTVKLPHGTGKKVRILVFCKPDLVEEAKAAGADYAGGKELVEKIQGGWLDFDVAVAERSMMRDISRLGRVLGPRGLMPSPKAGTVTDDIPGTVEEVKAGKIEFKTDKFGNVQVSVGKASFSEKDLIENIQTVMAEINRLRPASTKGRYIRKLYLSSTMSPSIQLDSGNLEI